MVIVAKIQAQNLLHNPPRENFYTDFMCFV